MAHPNREVNYILAQLDRVDQEIYDLCEGGHHPYTYRETTEWRLSLLRELGELGVTQKEIWEAQSWAR